VLAPVAIAGTAIIAAGIAASPAVEIIGVVGFTVAVVGLVTSVAVGARGRGALATGALSVAAVAGSMAFAFVYGVTTYAGGPLGLARTDMVLLHGRLNAAFALCALGGLRVVDPAPGAGAPTPGVPYSSLRSRGRIGTDFFRRREFVDEGRTAEGMVDDFGAFDRPGFDPAAVAPGVRAVYERSAETDLRVTAAWSRGLRGASRLCARLVGPLEQLHLPAHGARVGDRESAVIPVDEPGAGRGDARAWTRWYADSGRAMYVASYETHEHEERRCLNVVFPLPWCNLTGVLRPENDGAGLVLSSHRDGGDDAVHEVDCLGRRLVTLVYDIRAGRAGGAQ